MKTLTVQIEKEVKPNVHVVHFIGAFDGGNRDPLTELESLIEAASSTQFVFDFSGLEYMNSYAIGTLIGWQNGLSSKNSKIILAAVRPNIEDILGIIGSSQLFLFKDDVPSALEATSA